MSLGLKRGIVQLEPHDKQWDEAAIQTIKILKSILGDDAIDIQHIGSTAIPAIKAKPIIDIVVGVTDFDKVMLHNEQLRQVGIFYRGSDVERQFLYVMGDMENDTRTHHIHIVKWNGTEWKNYIHFRDYLNDNENMALQYQKVKEELESKYADDRVAYTNGKQDMIDLILAVKLKVFLFNSNLCCNLANMEHLCLLCDLNVCFHNYILPFFFCVS